MTSLQIRASIGFEALWAAMQQVLRSSAALVQFVKEHKYVLLGGLCSLNGLSLAVASLQRDRPLPKLQAGSYHEIVLGDSRRLGFAELGAPCGRPVLFLHGTPGGRAHGLVMHEEAVKCGVRLIVPFRTGYGASDQKHDRTVADYASDVIALFEHLAIERFAVLGVSGGGAYACAVAHALRDRVSACALVCSVSPLDAEVIAGMHPSNRITFKYVAPFFARLARTPLCHLSRRPARAIVALQLGLAGFVVNAQVKQIALLEGADPLELSRVLSTGIYASIVDDTEFARPSTAMGAMVDAALLARDWGFDLGEITVPTRIWHGERDVQAPPLCAHRLSNTIPGSSLKMLAAGHLSCWVQCREEVLEYLAAAR